jgi:hypothetical protein
MFKTCVRLLATAAIFGASAPLAAQVGEAPPPGQQSLTEFAAEYYAKEHGVSLAEAKRQIAEIKRVGEAMREAGFEADDSGAGIEIDRSNGFSVSVRFAGAKGKAVQALEARGIKTKKAEKSKKQYKDEIRQLANSLGVKAQDYAVVYDDLANTATLLIKGKKEAFPTLPALPAGVNVEFRDELITITANIYGSDSIAEAGTVGYVALRGGLRGVTAAGHAHAGYGTFTVNGDVQTIGATGYNGNNDLVWGRNASSAYGAWIRVTSAGAWKAVKYVGTLHSATPYCKYGKTTGVTCGTYSRTYTGAWKGGTGTFPLIKGSVQMALEGDSGGPVFEDYGTNVSAIGTVIGHINNLELVVYPVDRFSTYGVTVATQ